MGMAVAYDEDLTFKLPVSTTTHGNVMFPNGGVQQAVEVILKGEAICGVGGGGGSERRGHGQDQGKRQRHEYCFGSDEPSSLPAHLNFPIIKTPGHLSRCTDAAALRGSPVCGMYE